MEETTPITITNTNIETNPQDLEIDPNDEESILINVNKLPNEIVQEYSMNTWYEGLKEHTFQTVEIELGLREIDCIISHIRRSYTINHHLSDLEKQIMKELEDKINEALQDFGGFGFVKLSTRSPKDAVYERSHSVVERLLTESLNKLIEEKNDPRTITDNDLLIILSQACNQAMKVSTGKEALALITNSDRVNTDLQKAKELLQIDPDNKDLAPKIMIRAWVDIPIEHEFRGFVCKKQLNALAQYFHYCYFPKLLEEKDQIQNRVLEYYDSIKDLIPHENFVIDFGILADGSMKVIEINPFHYSTGAPFFGWKKGSEGRQIILYGPYTFRVATEPMAEGRTKYMSACWDKFFKTKIQIATKSFQDKQGCVIS